MEFIIKSNIKIVLFYLKVGSTEGNQLSIGLLTIVVQIFQQHNIFSEYNGYDMVTKCTFGCKVFIPSGANTLITFFRNCLRTKNIIKEN